MTSIKSEQLMAEIEDIIRTMPSRSNIRMQMPENIAWLGRASAAMHLWDSVRSVIFDANADKLQSGLGGVVSQGYVGMLRMLHQATHELRLQSSGTSSVAIAQGGVFHYFDEIRKVIETAKTDLFFVDPYLDAEFVSRYLSHVSEEVTIRLLTRERIKSLLPAVKLLQQQNKLEIEVRTSDGFHDRYVLVDRQSCYQSGASFKDGARKAPTILTQILDAHSAVLETYENLWSSAVPAK